MAEERNDENVNHDPILPPDEHHDVSVRNEIGSAYHAIVLPPNIFSALHRNLAGANSDPSQFEQLLDRKLEKSYREQCTESTTQTEEDLHIYDFMHNLEKMLETGQYSDIIIKCKETEYKAHRNILAAQSSVFKEMMKRTKDSGIINIKDCEPDIFAVLLRFMYSGRAQNLNCNNVKDLYIAGNRYHIVDLCDVCLEYMMYHISVENFCDIMAFSAKYRKERLYKEAALFFFENSTAIVESSKWSSFLRENESLGYELLTFHNRIIRSEKWC